MFSRPPAYRSPAATTASSKKKPKRKVQFQGQLGPVNTFNPATVQSIQERRPAQQNPAGPVGRRISAPAQGNPPASTVAPPVVPTPTYRTAADRIEAQGTYDQAMIENNRQLRALAAAYGGAPSVTQFGYDADPNDPYRFMDKSYNANVPVGLDTSTLAGIQRDQDAALLTMGEAENAADKNDYFSGRHLKLRGNVNDEAARQRAKAYADYMDAVARIVAATTGAQNTRNISFGEALATEIGASNESEPEAENTPNTSSNSSSSWSTAPASQKKPKTKKDTVAKQEAPSRKRATQAVGQKKPRRRQFARSR